MNALRKWKRQIRARALPALASGWRVRRAAYDGAPAEVITDWLWARRKLNDMQQGEEASTESLPAHAVWSDVNAAARD